MPIRPMPRFNSPGSRPCVGIPSRSCAAPDSFSITFRPLLRSSVAINIPRIVSDFMLGKRHQNTDMPMRFSASSHFL